MPWAQRLLPLGIVVFVAFVAVFTFGTSRSIGPPVWFLVFWLGALAWNVYWWLFRVCVEVRVEDRTVSWAAVLRRGNAPMTDVRRLRRARMSRQMAVIELQGRRPLLVPVRYGFSELQNAIAAGAPQADIEPS